MDFSTVYTSLNGRIGRQTWWIAMLVIIVVYLLVSFLVLPLVGFSLMPDIAALSAGTADPAQVSAVISAGMAKAAWASLVLYLIFAFPIYAVGIKRRQDKDNNGLDLKIYIALNFVVLLLQAMQIGYTTLDAGNGITLPMPGMFTIILGFAVGILGLYLLVMMGFLKGTTGPNQYGDDPLGRV